MTTLLSALSRSYKAAQYCARSPPNVMEEGDSPRRKRKRSTNTNTSTSTSASTSNVGDVVDKKQTSSPADPPCCFEVRQCHKNGIGMFATLDIECGSLILEHEDPIVSTHRSPPPLHLPLPQQQKKISFCHFCVAPLGTLKDQVQQGNNNEKDLPIPLHVLPYLDSNNKTDLVFTAQPIIECKDCQQVAWCNQQCAESAGGQSRHRFLCRGIAKSTKHNNNRHLEQQFRSLEAFYETVDNPPIFQLAVDGITAILSEALSQLVLLSPSPEEVTETICDPTAFHFWNDYGSHPLWWEIGSSAKANERKTQTELFSKLLCDFFSRKCRTMISRPRIKSLLDSTIAEVCTMDNIGKLLGMLQSNVMEFTYLSPLEQYVSHLEQDVEDEDDEDDNSKTEESTIKAKAAKEWLEQYRANNLQEEDTGIVGSGLYPLLTLANHDCDPNASIDFLQESNRGSMVALRNIAKDEEICITYVPNGDLDAGGTSERFRHFEPTRTWKWLNSRNYSGSDDDDNNSAVSCASEEADINNDDEDGIGDNHSDCSSNPGNNDEQHESTSSTEAKNANTNDDDDDGVEGDNCESRAAALLEYGFECQCERCLHEKLKPAEEYDRN